MRSAAATSGEVATARAVAVQADGSVVVGGRWASCTRVSINYELFRLTPAGAVDPTFADRTSRSYFDYGGDRVVDIAIQGDGKLVAIVDTYVGPATTPDRNDAFTVLRVNSDGTLDTTFDGDGGAIVLFGGGLDATAVAAVVQPSGKIVVGGSVGPDFNGGDFALARLGSDGSPDSAFGTDGRVVTDLGSTDALHALALYGADKVVAAGTSGGNVAVARYLAPDTSTDSVAGVRWFQNSSSGLFAELSRGSTTKAPGSSKTPGPSRAASAGRSNRWEAGSTDFATRRPPRSPRPGRGAGRG